MKAYRGLVVVVLVLLLVGCVCAMAMQADLIRVLPGETAGMASADCVTTVAFAPDVGQVEASLTSMVSASLTQKAIRVGIVAAKTKNDGGMDFIQTMATLSKTATIGGQFVLMVPRPFHQAPQMGIQAQALTSDKLQAVMGEPTSRQPGSKMRMAKTMGGSYQLVSGAQTITGMGLDTTTPATLMSVAFLDKTSLYADVGLTRPVAQKATSIGVKASTMASGSPLVDVKITTKTTDGLPVAPTSQISAADAEVLETTTTLGAFQAVLGDVAAPKILAIVPTQAHLEPAA